VTFNQPMDNASAEKAFLVARGECHGRKDPGYVPVGYRTHWLCPLAQAGFGQDLLRFGRRRRQVGGRLGGDAQGIRLDVPDRAVSRASFPPSRPNGDKFADPYGSFEMVFSAPIDPSTVMRNVYIKPEPKATDVYTYYSRSDRRFVISFDRKPSTDYTVQSSRASATFYGNQLNKDTTVKFTTRALDPSVYLNVPGQNRHL